MYMNLFFIRSSFHADISGMTFPENNLNFVVDKIEQMFYALIQNRCSVSV